MKVKVTVSHKRATELLNEYCYQEMHKSFPDCNVFVTIEPQEQVTLQDMSMPALTKLVHDAFVTASKSNFNANTDVNPLTGESLVTTARKFVTKYLNDNYSR